MSDFDKEINMDDVGTVEEQAKKVTWGIKIPADKKEQLDKIKDFCGSGEDAADSLIRAFKLMNAGVDHADRQTEVETFTMHINAIQDAFVRSLQTCDDVKEMVSQTKDEEINKLRQTLALWQEKASANEALAVTANTAAMEAENKQKQAELEAKDALEKMKVAQEAAKDKENINSMLTGKLAEAEAKLEDYPVLKERNEHLEDELAKALQLIRDNQKDAQIAQERAVAAIQKEMDKALVEKDQALASAELKAEKALSALEKEKNADNQKLRDKIDSLKDERADLKDEIASLKAELQALKNKKETK